MAAPGPCRGGRSDPEPLRRNSSAAWVSRRRRFLASAAASGHTRLGPELGELNTLAAAHGHDVFLAALERARAFRRWRAADARSILAAGTGTPQPRPAGTALVIELPTTPGRSLAEYAPATAAVSS